MPVQNCPAASLHCAVLWGYPSALLCPLVRIWYDHMSRGVSERDGSGWSGTRNSDIAV